MVNALVCNGSRVLTPGEAHAIRLVIRKPSNWSLFNLLLYTGMRFSEVNQLFDNPGIFDPERKTLTIASGKAKATQRTRNITLSDLGVLAVRAYLETPKKTTTSTAWQMNLIRWSRSAHLTPLNGNTEDQGGNPYGITVRTTRKSWESWLLSTYPDKSVYIALSQGHNETTALRHYLNLSFTPDEREDIKKEVAGWGQ
jgi:integrase